MQKTQNATPLQVAEYIAEAKRLGGPTSANQRRFMKAAALKGKDMEPVDVMAGARG
ncbi:hypothetical protein D3C87_1719860 [compost metagenome]